MEKRHKKTRQKAKIPSEIIPFGFLLACFAFAGIFGCFTIVNSGDTSDASLSLYLHRYMTLLSNETAASPSFLSVFCEFCIWPLITFVLGFTTLGVLLIPILFSVRAFLLSYAISAFFRVFGTAGLTAAVAVFGLNAFVSIPILFSVGSYAFIMSLRMAQGVFGSRFGQVSLIDYVSVLIPCGMLIFPAVFLQWSVVPQVLLAVSKYLILN